MTPGSELSSKREAALEELLGGTLQEQVIYISSLYKSPHFIDCFNLHVIS